MKHQSQASTALKVGQVQITFTNKQLTAWGGMCAILAKFFEKIGLKAWAESSIPVEENSPNGKGKYGKLLALVLTSLCGGTRFSHLAWWGHGLEAVKACFGVEWLPQAPSVLTRFFGKFTQRHAEQLRKGAADLTGRLVEAEQIHTDVLILDSTVCERYGTQEGARVGYNPRKPGRPSHHPLKASLGSGYVVNLWNRRGDTHTAHQCTEFYSQTRRELPQSLKISWVFMDCGFTDEKFLDFLEQEGTKYVGALRMTAWVKDAILGLRQWRQVAEGVEVGDARIALSTWNKARRLIVLRQHEQRRPKATGKQPLLFKEFEEHSSWRYTVLVSNEQEMPAEELWRLYCGRAAEENVIKELKHGYGWHEFNVHSFWGTEAAMLLIGMVCYNLVNYLNRVVLKTAASGVARLKTLRLRIWAIPAVYGSGGRSPALRLGVVDKGLRAKITYWLQVIHRLSLSLFKCNAVEGMLPVEA